MSWLGSFAGLPVSSAPRGLSPFKEKSPPAGVEDEADPLLLRGSPGGSAGRVDSKIIKARPDGMMKGLFQVGIRWA